MATYYVGMKFGQEGNPDNLVAGTSSAGATLDVEVRMETANGLTKLGTIAILEIIEAYIAGNGQGPGGGANLPPN